MLSGSAPLGALLAILGFALASPAPARVADLVAAPDPLITPSPVEYSVTRTFQHKRDIVSRLESGVGSILSALGSDIPSWVASGKYTWEKASSLSSDA